MRYLYFDVEDGSTDFDFDIGVHKVPYVLKLKHHSYGYLYFSNIYSNIKLEIKDDPDATYEITSIRSEGDNMFVQIGSLNNGKDLEGELRVVNNMSDELIIRSDWMSFKYNDNKLALDGNPFNENANPEILMNGSAIGLVRIHT